MKTINLKNTLLSTLLLLIVTTMSAGCYYIDGEKGNGNVKKETRNIGSFTELHVSGAFEVYLKQGNEVSLVVEADENLMQYIITEVSGNKLRIYTDKSIKKATEMNIYLTFEDLEGIDLSGAVELESENQFKLDQLEIDVSGATEIELDMKLNSLEIDASGASEMELSGSVGELSLDCSGASEFNSIQMEAKTLKIDASGACEAKVWVTQELWVESSGASSVRYKGNPKVHSDVSGAGSVKQY